jgi:hypothetical protein
MVKDYHKEIQKVLSIICDKNEDKFRKGFPGNIKIDINHPGKKNMSIVYFPDFTIIAKNGNYYIFQVLDSQENIQALTIANVVEAYLSEQVRKLYFIIKDSKSRDKVIEITETILAKIEFITNKKSIRSRLNVFYVTISQMLSEDSIKQALEEALFNIPKRVDKNIKDITYSQLGRFVLGKSRLM